MILNGLAEGYSNKAIGDRCNLTEAAVKVHMKSILRKIRVGNRTQAAIWALEKRRDSRAPPSNLERPEATQQLERSATSPGSSAPSPAQSAGHATRRLPHPARAGASA